MLGRAVLVREDGDRPRAELGGRAEGADGDLPTVGDEDLGEHGVTSRSGGRVTRRRGPVASSLVTCGAVGAAVSSQRNVAGADPTPARSSVPTLGVVDLTELVRYAPPLALVVAALAARRRLPRLVWVPAAVLTVLLVLPFTTCLAAVLVPLRLGLAGALPSESKPRPTSTQAGVGRHEEDGRIVATTCHRQPGRWRARHRTVDWFDPTGDAAPGAGTWARRAPDQLVVLVPADVHDDMGAPGGGWRPGRPVSSQPVPVDVGNAMRGHS